MQKHGNSIAREIAIQQLYSLNFQPSVEDVLTTDNLANGYIINVVDSEEELDEIIAPKLNRWDIKQINRVDLSILRLATYELKYSELSPKIIINEALELAKKYSEPKSKNFIHKVLDLITKDGNV